VTHFALRTPRDRAPRTLEGNEVGRRFYERRGRSLTDETRIVPYPPNPIDVEYALPLEPT